MIGLEQENGGAEAGRDRDAYVGGPPRRTCATHG
jgi:hypothetical protein